MNVSFRQFSGVVIDLLGKKPEEQQAVFTSFFKVVSPSEHLLVCRFFLGFCPPKSMGYTALKNLLLRHTGLSATLLTESYQEIGDWAETLALIYPLSPKRLEFSLREVLTRVERLSSLSKDGRNTILIELWGGMDFDERYVLNRWVLGSWRYKWSPQTLAQALTTVDDPDPSLLLRLGLQTRETAPSLDLQRFPLTAEEQLLLPWDFPAVGVHSDVKRITWKNQVFTLAPGQGFFQVVVGYDCSVIWSSDGDVLNHQYSELSDWGSLWPLQTRLLGHLGGSVQQVDPTDQQGHARPFFLIDDLLQYAGENLTALPYHTRVSMLETLLSTRIHSQVFLSEEEVFSSADDLRRSLLEVSGKGGVGFYVRDAGAPYGALTLIQRSSGWVNAVLTLVRRSPGKPLTFEEYTLSIYKDGALVPMVRLSELVDDILRPRLTTRIVSLLGRKHGPVIEVIPSLIFVVEYEGQVPAPRRKSGFSLVNPRVKVWLEEASLSEVSESKEL